MSEAAGCPSGLAAPAIEATQIDPAAFVRSSGDERTLELAVVGAKCGGCIAKIEGALRDLPGVETARLNLSTGKLRVSWRGDLAPRRVTETISGLGYRAAPYDPEASEKSVDAEGRFLLRCLAVAGFASANIMLLSVGVWSGLAEMGEATRGFMHFVSALIAIPAAAYAGRPFFSSAFRALKAGSANMDVPISLAVILAVGVSLFETARGGEEAYFDAAVMLLFFLLIGRWLDHALRNRARAAARDLAALQATATTRLRPDGSVEAISARDVAVGDRLVLAPGDRFPVDAVVEEGASDIDFSLVTGESEPVLKSAGDAAPAGVLNLSARLVARAVKTADASLVAELARLVEAGEQSRSKYVQLADKVAKAYVPVVHTLAAATLLGWLVIGGASFREAMMNAIAVLIITCPCALGLATPAVQVVATGRLFRKGILVKSGDALQRLAEATHVVFDKTGTLTLGRLAWTNRSALDAEDRAAVAAVARASRHPVSRAIVAAEGAGPLAGGVVETPGEGVEGLVDGARVRLGRAGFVGAEDAGEEGVSAWARIGEGAPLRLSFEDALRPDARETVSGLTDAGLAVSILSGDRPGAVASAAASAGIAKWRAETRPDEKNAALAALAAAGARVAMAGDGLNDAPALANAHVSLSPGSAAEAAQSAADFVFRGERLGAVLEARRVACAAQARIRQNFAFAALYNMVAAPLAMAGGVTPLIAALAMSGSSLVVTLNALRPMGLSARETDAGRGPDGLPEGLRGAPSVIAEAAA